MNRPSILNRRLRGLAYLLAVVAWTGGNLVAQDHVAMSCETQLSGQMVDDCTACPANECCACCGTADAHLVSCAEATPCDYQCPPWLTEYSWYQPPASCEAVDPRIYRSIFLGHLWVETEYLAWATSDTRLPSLTVSNSEGPIAGRAMFLYEPVDVHGDLRSGGRLTAGYWFTPEHCAGVEASFFGVDGHNVEFDSAESDAATVSRYVISRGTGADHAISVVVPGAFDGYSRVESDALLTGAEVSWRQLLRCAEGFRLDWVAGYRYIRQWDRLQILDHMVPFDGEKLSNTISIDRADQFETESEFHGAQCGLISRWWYRRWALQTLGKVALGGTRSGADVAGSVVRVEQIPDTEEVLVSAAPVGVLAGQWNHGHYGQSEFSAVGELGIRLEYAWTQQFRSYFGYNLLYLSSVTRVLDSVDAGSYPDRIPDPNDPADIESKKTAVYPRSDFTFQNSNFWTQGLSVGLHYEF